MMRTKCAMTPSFQVGLLLTVLMLQDGTLIVQSFHHPFYTPSISSLSRQRYHRIQLHSNSNDNDSKYIYNDFGSNNEETNQSNDSLNNPNDDGQLLAQEFYQQVRQREVSAQRKTTSNNNNNNNSNNPTWEMNDSSSYTKNFYTRKRGDLDSTGTPSAGLFANRNGSVYAYPTSPTTSTTSRRLSTSSSSSSSSSSSAKDKIMRTEFNILSLASNEFTLLVQLSLVLLLLSFSVYIGLTGGITDGSERFISADYDSGLVMEYTTTTSSTSPDFGMNNNNDVFLPINLDDIIEKANIDSTNNGSSSSSSSSSASVWL